METFESRGRQAAYGDDNPGVLLFGAGVRTGTVPHLAGSR